ncbi:hypothetical protein ACFQ7B_35595 [Streptomyces erythrochromogenes]|uniref:hypothetical protein n=1 Tax=Streptomyces erythrochromogenes TaxID=285574 RepID=UPI00368BDA1E
MSDVRRDPLSRATAALGSPAVGTAIGIAGLVVPVVGWAVARVNLKALLLVQAVLILVLAAGYLWVRKNYIPLCRANNLKAMDDAAYYDLVRARLEAELISDYGEIADGHLRVYAAEVPRLSTLLVNTVTEAQAQPQRILAADLTTNPTLLTGRREYIAANRRFTEAGGRIDRLFIVHAADLAKEEFASSPLELVGQHRDLGVTCGLAVRDRLRADQAVDVVIFAQRRRPGRGGAGRRRLQPRAQQRVLQGHRPLGRPLRIRLGPRRRLRPRVLQTYEATARPMLDAGTWDASRINATVAGL